jgi:phosphate starvation-inducible PhoH-like protein
MAKKSVVRGRKQQEDKIIADINTSFNTNVLSRIKIDIKHKNDTQKKFTQSIKQNDVTVCSGPAGTGKTFLTVAEAILLLKTHPDIYHNIRLLKSVTQLKGEDIGFLPGEVDDKLKYNMMSFINAFNNLIGEANTNKLIEAGMIKFELFGSIRGLSYKNAIIIVDEFQNIDHDKAKTFLTRFEPTTKVIVLGDTEQIDIKNKHESSLRRLIDRVTKKPTEGVGVIEFDESHIVRNRLTSYFIDIFKEDSKPKEEYRFKAPQPVKKLSFLDKLKNFIAY